MILASTGDTMDLATLADMADKVIEVAALSVSAISQPSPGSDSEPQMHTCFLVDTGSEVSAIPPTHADRRHSLDKLTLMAVNNTPVYMENALTLNLGLRRSLPQIFIVADVQKPILGADSLRNFGLLVDMQKQRLINTDT